MQGLFCYRDVFFVLIYEEDLAQWRLIADDESEVLQFSYPPALNDVRKVCDDYIEKLMREMLRVSGDVECETCEKLLRQHPIFEGARDWDGRAYLHRRCDGRLLKL